MTDLPATGPAVLDLRWGKELEQRPDGRLQRALFPRRHQQEADGYLHPGVAAACVIGAVEKTLGLSDRPGSVAVRFDAPVPLGMDLRAVVGSDDGTPAVRLQVEERPGVWDEPVRDLAHGLVRSGDDHEVAGAGALRSAAISPAPGGEEHDLYPRCFVCGQSNPRGLGLLPAWQTQDTVVTAFMPGAEMADGEGRVPPTMVATLLSCPTLWACREQLRNLEAPAALLATYEVRLLGTPRAGSSLRAVGLVGEADERSLHASSALVAEEGTLHAVATATWLAIEDVPGREPRRPRPGGAASPLKGGRPEERSPRDWGESLPGRREVAGPRSERPDDHDARETMDVPVAGEDPAEPRRSLLGDG